MSEGPYAELPDPGDDPYLLGQFIRVINQFWKNGGGVALFADKAPLNYQANILIETFFPESRFRIGGNHQGGKYMKKCMSILAGALAGLMALSFVSCGGKKRV